MISFIGNKMSLRKIESIKIEFEPEIIRSKKVKVILTEDEKAYLCEVKKEMEAKIKECKEKIKTKTELYKKEDAKIKIYRREISKKLGIFTAKQLHDMKKVYNKDDYQKILQKNREKSKQCENLVKDQYKKDTKTKKLKAKLKADLKKLKAELQKIPENIKQQHENAWYIFGESCYQEIAEKFKNEHHYYIKVFGNYLKGFYIKTTSGGYYLSRPDFIRVKNYDSKTEKCRFSEYASRKPAFFVELH